MIPESWQEYQRKSLIQACVCVYVVLIPVHVCVHIYTRAYQLECMAVFVCYSLKSKL